MDEISKLIATLLRIYGAPDVSATTRSSAPQSASLVRASASQRNLSFEQLIAATRNVGHELVSLLANRAILDRALDHLPFGLFLVTADLKVLFANKVSRALTDSDSGLSLVKRRLTCMDELSHQRLKQYIQRLHAGSKSAQNTVALRVARLNNRPDLQLKVVSCDKLLPTAAIPDTPDYCILAFDPNACKTIDSKMLRELHGLTLSEAAVTAALFRGLSIDEVAVELCVTANTIKTHLKRIFQKCEVHSQAELLQTLALGPR